MLFDADFPTDERAETPFSKFLESNLQSGNVHMTYRHDWISSFLFGTMLGLLVGHSNTNNSILQNKYVHIHPDQIMLMCQLRSTTDGSTSIKTFVFRTEPETVFSGFFPRQLAEAVARHFGLNVPSLESLDETFQHAIAIGIYRYPVQRNRAKNNPYYPYGSASDYNLPFKVKAYKKRLNILDSLHQITAGYSYGDVDYDFITLADFVSYTSQIAYPLKLLNMIAARFLPDLQVQQSEQNFIQFMSGFTHGISNRFNLKCMTRLNWREPSEISNIIVTKIINYVGSIPNGPTFNIGIRNAGCSSVLPVQFQTAANLFRTLKFKVVNGDLDFKIKMNWNVQLSLGTAMVTSRAFQNYKVLALCEFVQNTIKTYKTDTILAHALIGQLSNLWAFRFMKSYYIALDNGEDNIKTFIVQRKRYASVIHIVKTLDSETVRKRLLLNREIFSSIEVEKFEVYVICRERTQLHESMQIFQRVNRRYFKSTQDNSLNFKGSIFYTDKIHTLLQIDPEACAELSPEHLIGVQAADFQKSDFLSIELQSVVSNIFEQHRHLMGFKSLREATALLQSSLQEMYMVSNIEIPAEVATMNFAATRILVPNHDRQRFEQLVHILTYGRQNRLPHDIVVRFMYLHSNTTNLEDVPSRNIDVFVLSTNVYALDEGNQRPDNVACLHD